MRRAWLWTWATVAFVSELAALVALALVGWSLDAPGPVRVLAAVGLPLVAAVLWALFAAPRAVLPGAVLAAVTQVLVYGGGVVSLILLRHPIPGAVLAVAAAFGRSFGPAPDALTGLARR